MSGSTLPPGLAAAKRNVRCPSCGQSCIYGPSNPARPFCSTHCRNADFGAWASESYRVPAKPEPDDDEAEPA